MRVFALVFLVGIGLTACGQNQNADKASTADRKAVAAVDGARIIAADSEPGAWMSHGRTYDEQRFSPLKKINDQNVADLGLAWSYRLDVDRGTEATPIVVDGVMYATGALSIVYALNPVTGELLWKFDPKVPAAIGGKGCCDVVNRGVAVWDGKVYVGAYDGRLIALDASSGEPVWSVNTIIDRERNYTITGAPRIIKGKVIIGNGGAELGVRGYITAYDAQTGEQAWRFFTVPGDPSKPPEDKAMEMAQKTWHGDTYWKQGGGGTVWDSMAYDPELDLLYIGTGNGSPWNIKYRSQGKGDNLFLSSIVALKPDTGEYVWHYQTTPGDTWDYTATQHIVLADLEWKGEPRKVLMQAPKNGFFYVLDRASGELLSAENFVPINWASHVDMQTGRPVVTETGDYSDKPELIIPAPFGAHNWQPMSYNPETGLVYIPAQYNINIYEDAGGDPVQALNVWNIGLKELDLPIAGEPLDQLRAAHSAALLAWDPVEQKEVWKVAHPQMWNGGVLSTAGNLVFQGNAQSQFRAYAADSGEQLWSAPANTGVIAAPISYEIDGEQYVTVMAGWGGAYGIMAGGSLQSLKTRANARVLTFKLGGNAELPTLPDEAEKIPPQPPLTANEEQLATGKTLYNGLCWQCHGLSAQGNGVIQDLRYLDQTQHENFASIVKGASYPKGMPSFAHVLDDASIGLIQQYLIKRSNDLKAQSAAAPTKQ
ncbi:MAG: PQQ-dependent dehydrogenase, methanol/ethanol family [Panacagrimonas sp.]